MLHSFKYICYKCNSDINVTAVTIFVNRRRKNGTKSENCFTVQQYKPRPDVFYRDFYGMLNSRWKEVIAICIVVAIFKIQWPVIITETALPL